MTNFFEAIAAGKEVFKEVLDAFHDAPVHFTRTGCSGVARGHTYGDDRTSIIQSPKIGLTQAGAEARATTCATHRGNLTRPEREKSHAGKKKQRDFTQADIEQVIIDLARSKQPS
jgi:hypothetical protein